DEHLRQLDACQDLPWREAKHSRCLDLALGNRLEAGAEDLGEVGAAVCPEAEHAGGKRIESHPDCRPTIIEQKKLDQKWRAADKVDVAAAGPAKRRQRQGLE